MARSSPYRVVVPGVEVTAICTSREETAHAAAARHSIARPFWDAVVMCADPQIDIVDLGTRPSVRLPMVPASEKAQAAVREAMSVLRQSAGNLYINDKPTGAVVGQQPFGGARGSGTNDKAGSILNLIRWVSPRTIKETLVPPKDYRYPFLEQD